MTVIDAHIHYDADLPEFQEAFEQLDIKLLNVCVAHDPGEDWRGRARAFRRLAVAKPERFAWATACELPLWGESDYAGRAIAALERDFAAGAVRLVPDD